LNSSTITSVTIDELLAQARAEIGWRPTPGELDNVVARGGIVVDIRPLDQRRRHGELRGALVIDRNVLEWRLDPASPHRVVDVHEDQVVVLVCNEGYASTLAASVLRQLGISGATDLAGGFQAWRASARPSALLR